MTRRSWIAVGALVVVVTLLAALTTPLLSAARARVWQAWVGVVARAGGPRLLVPEQAVVDQLAALRAENIRLKAELADYAALRSAVGSMTFEGLRTIGATVAGEPLDVFHTDIVLNKGSRDGVTLGAPVVINESVLIGYVTELTDRTAVCRLLLHPNTNLRATIPEAETEVTGLLRGVRYTSLALTTIPRDVTIKTGQAITTVSQNQTPAGLHLGTIEDVQLEENEAYQTATVLLPYVPDEITTVTILVAP